MKNSCFGIKEDWCCTDFVHTSQASEDHCVPTRPRHQKTIMSPHALKGQKLLAQGIALGYYGRKPVALFYSN